ncbi:MAG: glucosaminidase domain-containing protein [Lachnospiraceae bacterium]|nr:glucosaminidase domain-containing protein [Lachnospiraceae bacterium]
MNNAQQLLRDANIEPTVGMIADGLGATNTIEQPGDGSLRNAPCSPRPAVRKRFLISLKNPGMGQKNRPHKFSPLFFCLLLLLLLMPAQSVLAEVTDSSAAATLPRSSASEGKWVKKSGKLKYRFTNKVYAKSGFFQIGNYWYYFDRNGCVTTGWFTAGRHRYFASKNSAAGKCGRIYSGWHTISGKTYFFLNTQKSGYYGRMLTGWQNLKSQTYYFNKEGILQTGWKTIGGKRFHFATSGSLGKKGQMSTGWKTIGKKKYYFRTTGKKGEKGACYKSEWASVDGVNTYFNSNGTVNPNTMSQEQFIKTIGKLAKQDMKRSGILASVTIAQAILESASGTSSLAMEAHNLFGMKATLSGNAWASSWDGTTFQKSTKEYLNNKWYTITDTFRSYDTFAQSLADHSAYLSHAMNGSQLRYKGVIGNKSYKKTIQIIKKGGYATDPAYVSKVCNIIKTYKLTKYDK